MDVLNTQLKRWRFISQQALRSHYWLALLFVLTLVMAGLVVHGSVRRQALQHVLTTQPAPMPRATLAPTARPVVRPMVRHVVQPTLQDWPSAAEADRISADILSQADAMGMLFERAEFQSLPLAQPSLLIQRIKLPVKGDYLQVRYFLQQVLQRYPSLALSQLKLQRSDVMQTEVEAYIEFHLYLHNRGQS